MGFVAGLLLHGVAAAVAWGLRRRLHGVVAAAWVCGDMHGVCTICDVGRVHAFAPEGISMRKRCCVVQCNTSCSGSHHQHCAPAPEHSTACSHLSLTPPLFNPQDPDSNEVRPPSQPPKPSHHPDRTAASRPMPTGRPRRGSPH